MVEVYPSSGMKKLLLRSIPTKGDCLSFLERRMKNETSSVVQNECSLYVVSWELTYEITNSIVYRLCTIPLVITL